MEVDLDIIRQHYSRMSTEDLAQLLQEGGLRPEARDCLTQELAKRSQSGSANAGEDILPTGELKGSRPEIEEGSFDDRVMCSDESCVGIIGPTGRCGTCGKIYKTRKANGAGKVAARKAIAGPPAASDGGIRERIMFGFGKRARQTKSFKPHVTPIDKSIKSCIEAMQDKGLLVILQQKLPSETLEKLYNWATGTVKEYEDVLHRKEALYRDLQELPCSKDIMKIALLLCVFFAELCRAATSDKTVQDQHARIVVNLKDRYSLLSMFQDNSQLDRSNHDIQNLTSENINIHKLTEAQLQQYMDECIKAATTATAIPGTEHEESSPTVTSGFSRGPVPVMSHITVL